MGFFKNQGGRRMGGWSIVMLVIISSSVSSPSSSNPSRAQEGGGHNGGRQLHPLVKREGPTRARHVEGRHGFGVTTTITIVTTNITATTVCGGEEGLCTTTTATTTSSTSTTSSSFKSAHSSEREEAAGGGGEWGALAMPASTHSALHVQRRVHGCGPGPLDCLIGKTCCGILCVDLNTDKLNCGECGLACADDESCELGLCGYAS